MRDGKYGIADGRLVKLLTGEPIPEDEPVFLLRARDRLALPLLRAYEALAIKDGCNEYHLNGIITRLREFEEWTRENEARMKQPGCTMGR